MKVKKMSEEFSKEDFDLMFQAIQSWEQEELGPGFLSNVMCSIFGDKDPETRQKYDDDFRTGLHGRQKQK